MKRAIDLRGAISINVITMIGIGPLVTIPLVIAALGGPLALVGWIAGAIVALCDGLVWAELSSRFPGSGGTYVYLRDVFGAERLGRGARLPLQLAVPACSAMPLGQRLYRLCELCRAICIRRLPATCSRTTRPRSASASVTLDRCSIGARRNVSASSAVARGGGDADRSHWSRSPDSHTRTSRMRFTSSQPVRFGAGLLAGFGSALYITLYDYAGYADVALLGDEVIRPRRTIPLSILLSVLLVAVLYVLLQIGVLGVVPWQSLLDAHGQPTAQAQYVGAFVVERTWGRAAALAVTLLVLVTAFASLYGNLLGFSRISFAAARDGAFLPAFATLHPRKDIPHVALLAVGILSLIASLFHARSSDRVLDRRHRADSGRRASRCAVRAARAQDRTRRFGCRSTRCPRSSRSPDGCWRSSLHGHRRDRVGPGLARCRRGCFSHRRAQSSDGGRSLALLLISFVLPAPALRCDLGSELAHLERLARDHGARYPVFAVDGKPFFVYGAAFFYERIPREHWRATLLAYYKRSASTRSICTSSGTGTSPREASTRLHGYDRSPPRSPRAC